MLVSEAETTCQSNYRNYVIPFYISKIEIESSLGGRKAFDNFNSYCDYYNLNPVVGWSWRDWFTSLTRTDPNTKFC